MNEAAQVSFKFLGHLVAIFHCFTNHLHNSAFANVIPIFKQGFFRYCNKYHLISQLCSISKVFGKLIFNHIYSYLKCYGLINEHQSEFTQGDSTIKQLIAICNKLYKNIDCGNEILAVFFGPYKSI